MREKLDYIYYCFYQFQISVGNATVAVPFALLFLSYLVMLNFFSVAFIAYALTGIRIPFHNAVIDGILVSALIIIINYFLFIAGKRYKKIITTYQKVLKKQIKKTNLIIIVYMVSTFILIGVGFYLMILRNEKMA